MSVKLLASPCRLVTEMLYWSRTACPFLVGLAKLTNNRRRAVPAREALNPELAKDSIAATVSFMSMPRACAAGPAYVRALANWSIFVLELVTAIANTSTIPARSAASLPKIIIMLVAWSAEEAIDRLPMMAKSKAGCNATILWPAERPAWPNSVAASATWVTVNWVVWPNNRTWDSRDENKFSPPDELIIALVRAIAAVNSIPTSRPDRKARANP